MTAGVGGANIGAGLLMLAGSPIVAALVCGVVVQHNQDRPMPRAMYLTLVTGAVALAPALVALLVVLRRITARS